MIRRVLDWFEQASWAQVILVGIVMGCAAGAVHVILRAAF